MPLFPHLDHENEVQVNDRTSLDAQKTFISVNETQGFSYLAIQPGADQGEFQVYATALSSRHLDWEFDSLLIDIDSTNNKFQFSETGATLTATLTSGTYTLAQLATELATQLNTVGAFTYTVSVDTDDKMTISADSAFNIVIDGSQKNNLIYSQLFFDDDDITGKTSYTSSRIEYGTRKITLTAGENRNQISTVSGVTANTSHALNNKYFVFWSALNETKYYAWFNSASTGTDPAVANATGVEIALSNNDAASVVAAAIALAINALSDFSATSSNTTVTITNSDYGFATTPREGLATGFSFAVSTMGQVAVTETSYIKVYSEEGDRLFCSDSDLEREEPEILRYVKGTRNTYKDVHRAVQSKILEDLDRNGFVNVFGDKYTKWDLIDISEVKEWARYMALRIIFEGLGNAKDDIFRQKASDYASMETTARGRVLLRIDTDKSGSLETDEGLDHSSIRLFFR